jgi:mRNA-degrading endonuclease YafQ of YafQ-DinJ toxin-antitoxin module
MFKLLYTFSYEEKAKKFLKKHPNIKTQYRKTLELLEINPYHPSLRLHQFKTSSFEGYSVSINLSYRIALEFLVTEKEIILVNIGDHQEIYGKK